MVDTKVVGFGDADTESKEISKNSSKKSGGFSSLNLSYPVLKGIQKRGYKLPTPIQRKCIPIALEGRDVVAMARTGSGKTVCFLVPMFEKLKQRSAKAGARALILSPTRELAIQTLKFVKEIGKFTDLKSIAVLGGDSMDEQFGAIHGNPDIIVATPGRFLHLCVEMELKLTSVEYVVFDEADRLFEMGFGEQLKEILNRLPDYRQTLLFSATLPKLLVDFAKAGLQDPVLIRLDVETKLPENLKLGFFVVRQEEKPAGLLNVLHVLPKKSQTVVFTATKHHVEYIHLLLERSGITSTMIYSDLDPSARKINAAKFQNGRTSVLIVTDVAARGIDIPQLDYVINYHFPAKSKLFVHRVGRCARAGRSGTAFSIISHDEFPYVLDLHMFLGRPLNLLGLEKKNESDEGAVGKIPQSLLEEELTEIINWHESSVDMSNMKNVCSNAYRQYLKCRPGASVESVKRIKTMDFTNVDIHPMFANNTFSVDNLNFLEQMKKFKPNGTIFELNMSAKDESYSVMKATRKAHENHLKKSKCLNNEKPDDDSHPITKLASSDNKDIENTFGDIIVGRKRKWKSDINVKNKKRKKSSYIDEEHYIPHFAPDHHTEAGLSVNSFGAEANSVSFDMTGDTSESIHLQKKLMKWDKTKKKMVGVENKVGKIRTESGVWIPATYKSKRYAEWKQKSKVDENEDESEEEEDAKNKSMKKNNYPMTNWGRHNRKLAEKLKEKSELKRPEQILKARIEDAKKKWKSKPKAFKKRAGRGRRKR